MKRLQSCVTPAGEFVYGIHKPSYAVTNLRQETSHAVLGADEDDAPVGNSRNLPEDNIQVENADWIYEIPNPFHSGAEHSLTKSGLTIRPMIQGAFTSRHRNRHH